VIVRSGLQDIGTGTRTVVAQIAAEEPGVDLDRVRVIMGDTALCPYGPTSGGSVTAASITPAVLAVAVEARERLKECAADELGIPSGQLAWAPGKFFVKTAPEKRSASRRLPGARETT